MPLLHRESFVRQKPPPDIDPDEEVFLCKITHEIFRSYDDFFERTILCNSLVWSCGLTGRSGLTYLEALESERRANQSLRSFPPPLLLPLLHLATCTHRARLTEMCEDVHAYVKERFFPGENVDVTVRNGTRHVCEILQVFSAHGSANGCPVANGRAKADPESIVITDSDEESPASQSPAANGKKKKKPLNASSVKYTVRMMKAQQSEAFTVKANQISRRKTLVSRERLKLLFKQHVELQDGAICLKPSTVLKFCLSEQSFSQFFPDDAPRFPFSPTAKSRASPGQASLLKAAEKLKLLQQREEMTSSRQKKERDETAEVKRRERDERDRLKEEREKLKELHRKRFEEEKQKRREEKEQQKLEKEKEREKLKEEKKKYAERQKLWSKPREDMELEDLKPLPVPAPISTRLPPQLFGEALMVLEFLSAFGQEFDLKDEFPDGVNLEVLEEALVGCDPDGPLCELLFFFLSAIFTALDQEQEEVKETEDLSEALEDDPDLASCALSAVCSLAAAWPQLNQGCSLKQLDLDSCTLSEILRLHILASGADCVHGNAKFRYQKQGGFTLTDDPCVELRLAQPALIKRLSNTAVYDLTPGEKLKILGALLGKLLTLASTRDLIEDCVEEQRSARGELREIQSRQHKRERVEAAHRVRVRKEEKLREQEQRMKEKVERLKELAGLPPHSELPMQLKTEEEDDKKKVKAQLTETESPSDLKPPPGPTAEELQTEQDKAKELLDRIQKAAACTSLLPLGRDRLYRRYWLLPSACALLVEEDGFGLTTDMLVPNPKPEAQETGAKMVEQGETGAKMEEEEEEEVAMKEEPEEESPGSSPSPLPSSDSPAVDRPNQWLFFSSEQEVDQLIDALNPRGHRESSLREALIQERHKLATLLHNADVTQYTHTAEPSPSDPECFAAAESLMEKRLRDLLLDIEDRIHQGTLGTLRVMDRQLWRSALEAGNYEFLCSDGRENGGMNGRVEAMEVESPAQLRARERLLKSDSAPCSGGGTPAVTSSCTRLLAQALVHIEAGLERRFLKAPLGEDDSKKDQKTKKSKKKDEDQTSEDGSDCGRVTKTVLERWRDSLQCCSSLSQVFVHLSTLERSVMWSRSVLNARCRICRRKGDGDNMLLCDSCDRGHHTHCLRPKLKNVPVGDWFCPDCRPKQRASRVPSRQRSSVDEEEEDEEEEETEEEEEETEEEEESEEEEEEIPVTTKKSPAPPPKGRSQSVTAKGHQVPPTKGRSQPVTPKSQQATPKNSSSAGKNSAASRSSGKKATPTSSKATPTSSKVTPLSAKATPTAVKPAPRPGSRVSARLSSEVQITPNSKTSKTSKNNSPQASKRQAATSTDLPPKAPRPVLAPPSSSSNRRSSGRHTGVHELSACELLAVDLVRHPDSWPFIKLVSRTQVPDYYDIVKKPIALSTIREKVNNCEYQTTGEFVSDVDLMFANCLQYNPRHTNEAKAGVRLQTHFHSELSRLGLSERSVSPPAKRSRL